MVSAIGYIWGGEEIYFLEKRIKMRNQKIKAAAAHTKKSVLLVAVLYEAIKFFNRLVFPQVLQWFTISLIINDTYDVYLTSIHFLSQNPVSVAVRRDTTNIYRCHQLLVWISALRWSYWHLEMSVKWMENLFPIILMREKDERVWIARKVKYFQLCAFDF